MIATLDPSTPTTTAAAITGVRWIDLAAVAGMALVWIGVAALLYGIFQILRSKARGDRGWGDAPGL
jgi:predicted phage tail protein